MNSRVARCRLAVSLPYFGPIASFSDPLVRCRALATLWESWRARQASLNWEAPTCMYWTYLGRVALSLPCGVLQLSASTTPVYCVVPKVPHYNYFNPSPPFLVASHIYIAGCPFCFLRNSTNIFKLEVKQTNSSVPIASCQLVLRPPLRPPKPLAAAMR